MKMSCFPETACSSKITSSGNGDNTRDDQLVARANERATRYVRWQGPPENSAWPADQSGRYGRRSDRGWCGVDPPIACQTCCGWTRPHGDRRITEALAADPFAPQGFPQRRAASAERFSLKICPIRRIADLPVRDTPPLSTYDRKHDRGERYENLLMITYRSAW